MTPVEAWLARGRRVPTVDGHVFMADSAFPDGAPGAPGAAGAAGRPAANAPARRERSTAPLLVLHGFPTSSWDFAAPIDALVATRRVVAFDFLGFGLSDKPAEFSYSLMEQADVAIEVVRAARLENLHLWAHDMGTSVATELLARRERGLLPFAIESLVLMNGSVHIEMAHLALGQRLLKTRLGPAFARLSTARTFKAQMRRVFVRQPGEAELEVMWELLSRDHGKRSLPRIIRYTEERSRFARRWIGALERLDIPAMIAWGAKDPVAVLPIGKRLANEIPGAELVTWPDLGHYPQLEDPRRVAETVERFLDRVEAHAPLAVP